MFKITLLASDYAGIQNLFHLTPKFNFFHYNTWLTFWLLVGVLVNVGINIGNKLGRKTEYYAIKPIEFIFFFTKLQYNAILIYFFNLWGDLNS